MRRFAAFLASAAFLSAPALAAGFDLRLDEADGLKTVAVTNAATGAFAIASGAGALDLLEGEAAKSAFDSLSAREDIDIRLDGDDADFDLEHDAEGKRRIIIHKMDYDEDMSGAEESREVRITKRRKTERDAGGSILDQERVIETEIDEGSNGAKRRRAIRIIGADAAEAAKFVDDIDGLEAGEKAAMKAAVGL